MLQITLKEQQEDSIRCGRTTSFISALHLTLIVYIQNIANQNAIKIDVQTTRRVYLAPINVE